MRIVVFSLLLLFSNLLVASPAFESHLDDVKTNDVNYGYLLESGDDALLARIHLIRQARETIDIQTFIWKSDDTGWFMFYELYLAAARGVRVRLLIDDLSLRSMPKFVAFLADLHPNLTMKQYNPLADHIELNALQTIGEMTVHFGIVNHRMHNKIVVVDDTYGITGGRNYQDDYFDRGVDRSFKDRDILVLGSVAKDMRRSFNEYWSSELAVYSRDMKDVREDIEEEEIFVPPEVENYQVPAVFDELSDCASEIACVQQRIVSPGLRLEEIIFVADHPGKHEDGDDLAETTESLVRLMQAAESRIVMQTPYLVAGVSGNRFFQDLLKNSKDMEVLVSTNSLGAADHFYAYAFSYKNKKKYLRRFKWQIHEMKPDPADFTDMVSQIDGVERSDKHYTCIHSKTYLFDDDVVWLGSYNLDPRSARLNTEAGVIIRDKAFFDLVNSHITRDMAPQNAWVIGPRRKVPILAFFNSVVENVFALIPIFNVWPFTYSTSYELREGGTVVPFFDDTFHDNYRSVGQFPGVNISGKALKTRLTKAFFGPAQPII